MNENNFADGVGTTFGIWHGVCMLEISSLTNKKPTLASWQSMRFFKRAVQMLCQKTTVKIQYVYVTILLQKKDELF